MSSASHVHHPQSDSGVTFQGLAAFEIKGDVKVRRADRRCNARRGISACCRCSELTSSTDASVVCFEPLSYHPPRLSDDFVEVAISHCGICGSDIHTIDSGWGPTPYPVIPGQQRLERGVTRAASSAPCLHALFACSLPAGHEIVGTVAAIGKDVSHIKVGDRVGIGAQCGGCLNKKNDCHECELGWDNHCQRGVWTYGSKYPDGQVSQGGYADSIRCQAAYAFRIPDSVSSEHAAPLMCGGVTVYAPLARSITRAGMRVGVIGIGGLGHLGVMFASKLLGGSAEVTAISHNSRKREESRKLGATKFIDTSDAEAMKKHARYFDYILCTANGQGQDYNNWLSLIKLYGASDKQACSDAH